MDAKEKTRRRKSGLTKVGEAKLVERLSKDIKFETKELWRLIRIYKTYLKDTWYMDAPTFSEFLHNSLGFTEEFFINRIFQVTDSNNDGRLDMEEFIRVIAVMLRGSREDKIKLCFNCYDLSENNELTRDDITALLVQAVTETPYKEVNPDTVRDLTETMLMKMDEDKDGVILSEEYKKACLENWLLTQAFGQCLPAPSYRAAFLILLETDQDTDSVTEVVEAAESDSFGMP